MTAAIDDFPAKDRRWTNSTTLQMFRGLLDIAHLSLANVSSGTFKLANMFPYEPEHPVEGVIVMLSLFEATKLMQEEFLRRVARWLNSGGTLLLCAFCTDDLSAYELEWNDDNRGAIVKRFKFMGKSVSFHTFTRARLIELLENAGLTKLRASLQTFFPPEHVQGDPGPDYFIMARKSEGSDLSQ